MLNRYKWTIFFGIVTVIITALAVNILSHETWLAPEDISIHIVIDNQTNQPIGPFIVSEYQDTEPLHVNQIEPFSKVDVYYKKTKSGGENEITMIDGNKKGYIVVPYFEQDQRGRVDIHVECANPDGLSGRIRYLVSWYFSFVWHSWGMSVCK